MSQVVKTKVSSRKSQSPGPQGEGQPRKKRRTAPPEDAAYGDDFSMDIDIETVLDTSTRHISSSSGAHNKRRSPNARSESGRSERKPLGASSSSVHKKVKKHRNIVYSDDDDDDEDFLAAIDASVKNDADDDFIPQSPPPSHHAKSAKKSTKASKSKEAPITFRDQRRLPVDPPTVITSSELNQSSSQKRSRTGDDVGNESTAAATPPVIIDEPKKKLPMPKIKKKNPTAGGASSTSTPVQKAKTPSVPIKPPPPAAVSSNAAGTQATVLSTNTGGRKSTGTSAATAELDLMNADVYASLFSKNANSQTVRAGVGQREALERRKELDRMRDDAKKARLTELEKTKFDLSSAQEKVAEFEAMLKERNSMALYPHHLGSYLKHNYKKLQ